MTPEQTQQLLVGFFQWLIGGGLIGLITWAAKALKDYLQNKKSDKKLDADINETVTGMADRMLKTAEERLTHTETRLKDLEARLDAAEKRADEADRRAIQAEHQRAEAREQARIATDHAIYLHDWIDDGATPPFPARPYWLRRQIIEIPEKPVDG